VKIEIPNPSFILVACDGNYVSDDASRASAIVSLPPPLMPPAKQTNVRRHSFELIELIELIEGAV